MLSGSAKEPRLQPSDVSRVRECPSTKLTRAKLIDPKLRAAGWDETCIRREFCYTQGRLYLVGDEHRRKMPKKVDYVLKEPNGLKVALVEGTKPVTYVADLELHTLSFAPAVGLSD